MNQVQTRVEDGAKWLSTDIRWTDRQDREVVRLRGNVDLERSSEIRKTLLEAVASKRDVLVDFAEVTYIDSSGIACLVEALHLARSRGADLGLVSVSTQAMRVLEIARLDLVFPILHRWQVEQVH